MRFSSIYTKSYISISSCELSTIATMATVVISSTFSTYGAKGSTCSTSVAKAGISVSTSSRNSSGCSSGGATGQSIGILVAGGVSSKSSCTGVSAAQGIIGGLTSNSKVPSVVVHQKGYPHNFCLKKILMVLKREV
jgi:hypothetical protein